MLNAKVVGIEAFGYGAKLRHIVVEFGQNIIPEVVSGYGLAIHEF